MKCAVNPPTFYPHYDLGSYSYLLAHVAQEDNVYFARCKSIGEDRGRFSILDCSTDELGEGIDGDVYFTLVHVIHPTEYIIPDILGNGVKSLTKGRAFLEKYAAEIPPGTNAMAVAQGLTYEDFINCYLAWLADDRVASIGIPYDIEFPINPTIEYPDLSAHSYRHGINRVALMTHLLNKGMLTKPIHLLGFNNTIELKLYAEIPGANIRSMDTTAPFAAAAEGKTWEEGDSGPKDWKPLDFSANLLDPKIVEYNLMALFSSAGDIDALFNMRDYTSGGAIPPWVKTTTTSS